MKILFAGPSLYHADPDLSGISWRPPASHGDLTRAVLDGAVAIGLVDGHFEATAAVWHKEILFALAQGVRVLGAASMGALRAAECQAFGMEVVGNIAERYASGELQDDAAVAQVHAPEEINFMPLTETLVDAEATIGRLRALELISAKEESALLCSAGKQFFKNRTAQSIVAGALSIAPERMDTILGAYSRHHYSLKTHDALLLVEKLRAADGQQSVSKSWEMAQPMMWQQTLQSIGAQPH